MLTLSNAPRRPKLKILIIKQGLSIQRDMKHCVNSADDKNYVVGTVPYLQTL